MPTLKRKGTLIVIDGVDGVGKATQTALLVKRLRKEGYKARTIDFPHYENFFGGFIGECLAGEHGDFISVDPYIVSVLYAADRSESKKKIESWLAQGYIVVIDRYVSANQIHQGGKIWDAKKRREFLVWLDKMEFKIFGLPRPDKILYLDVPRVITERLLLEKLALKKKKYLNGKQDLAEKNTKHLKDARVSALKLVRRKNSWIRIVCTKKGVLLSKGKIAETVWKKVRKIIE